ncbi:MAG TPA: nucleoside triphosphate pyrophosphohydrolase [Candidatus Binataceae bacterium]|nr:nucleoside triphosphate pyrophosphohydrolase [Candidatus Binataceae bacterium]
MSGPSSESGGEFARLLAVIRELRQRCPWDREQKLADSPRHIIEEAYEAADAIGGGDHAEIADELGDLIVQALFAGVIAAEEGPFDVAAILDGAANKLIRRHPHVYGDEKAETAAQVLAKWERIKAEERGNAAAGGSLRDAGRALPALMRAEKLGERARQAGMDWADAREVLAKVREELGEIEQALERGDVADAAEELGDAMLALANAPRFLGRNAEETLRRGCEKFIARFERVERIAAERGIDLKNLAPADVEALWQEAKKLAGSSSKR